MTGAMQAGLTRPDKIETEKLCTLLAACYPHSGLAGCNGGGAGKHCKHRSLCIAPTCPDASGIGEDGMHALPCSFVSHWGSVRNVHGGLSAAPACSTGYIQGKRQGKV